MFPIHGAAQECPVQGFSALGVQGVGCCSHSRLILLHIVSVSDSRVYFSATLAVASSQPLQDISRWCIALGGLFCMTSYIPLHVAVHISATRQLPVYILGHLYIYIHMHMHIRIYTDMHIQMHMLMYININMYIRVKIHMYIYIYTCLYMYT